MIALTPLEGLFFCVASLDGLLALVAAVAPDFAAGVAAWFLLLTAVLTIFCAVAFALLSVLAEAPCFAGVVEGFAVGAGLGDGFGDGAGLGEGEGFGDGAGLGEGDGFGDGAGLGEGDGFGDGAGLGEGDGFGDGAGLGEGDDFPPPPLLFAAMIRRTRPERIRELASQRWEHSIPR